MVLLGHLLVLFAIPFSRAGHCCATVVGQTSVYDEIFKFPVVPPTSACKSPYIWEPCPDAASCFAYHVNASHLGMMFSRNFGSCSLSPLIIKNFLQVYASGSTFAWEPGVYKSDISNITASSLNKTNITSIISNLTSLQPSTVAAKLSKGRFWQGQIDFQAPPTPRFDHVVFAVQTRVFVFAGVSDAGTLNDMYVFDAHELAWVNLTGRTGGRTPAPRGSAGAALCGADTLVLFGGAAPQGNLADIHTFDAADLAWKQLDTTITGPWPSARNSHSMACLGRMVYLFGGRASIALNDMYLLDLDAHSWTELTPLVSNAPPRRSGHGMTVLGGLIYLFGGRLVDLDTQHDMYVFDPVSLQWTDLTPALTSNGSWPWNRDKHGFVAAAGSLFIVGRQTPIFDVWKVDIQRMEWRDVSKEMMGDLPSIRALPGVAAWGEWIYLIGGSLSTSETSSVKVDCLLYKMNASTLAWSLNSWTVRGSFPSARLWTPLAESLGKVFVFGGYSNEETGSLGDFFTLDMGELVWENITSLANGQAPQPRDRHGLASVGPNLFIFGGLSTINGSSRVLGDLHTFHTIDLEWTDLSLSVQGLGPSPRQGHGFTSCEGKVYVMGGLPSPRVDEGHLGDFYVLEISEAPPRWAQLSLGDTGMPSPRFGHGLTAALGRLYVFGGYTQEGLQNDLYEFNIREGFWTQLTNRLTGSLPLARDYFGFTSAANKLYVFGGLAAGSYLNDLHVIDLNSSSISEIGANIQGSAPASRVGTSILAIAGRLLVFGGSSGSAISQAELFKFVTLPRRQAWPPGGAASGFLNVYDWDTVTMGSNATILQSIVLCTGVMPCSLELVGDPRGSLRRSQSLYISCFASDGCSWLHVRSVDFECVETGDELLAVSLLQVRGTELQLTNCSFADCQSATDGAVVRSHEGANVQMRDCLIRAARSLGYGGAVALVGSSMLVLSSCFTDCQADSGGGAIWASTYLCYWSQESGFSTELDVIGSTFQGCHSQRAGGAILMSSENTDSFAGGVSVRVKVIRSEFDGGGAGGAGGAIAAAGVWASVAVESCVFRDLLSARTGGAINSVDSGVSITSSAFLRSRSLLGGGAVWVSSERAAAATDTASTSPDLDVVIVASHFDVCLTNGTGGALVAATNDSATYNRLRLRVMACEFRGCMAENRGGGLYLYGGAVKAIVDGCNFSTCRARGSGGALALENAAEANLSHSDLRDNSAVEAGGGIYARSAMLMFKVVAASGNRALRGGGGALMWDGKISSDVRVASPLRLDCSADAGGNAAAYGPCIASSFHALDVTLLTSPAYPGLPLNLMIVKRDVYGQTITTDSTSLLQAFPKDESTVALAGGTVAGLRHGEANLTLTVNPRLVVDRQALNVSLAAQPRVLLRGIDAENTDVSMESPALALGMSEGSDVCPEGYVLLVDHSAFGSCLRCEVGTYVLNPLGGTSAGQSACMPCPPAAQCDGGPRVNFSLGVWLAERTFYRLVACPRNHQLVDSFSGAFNPAAQQCQPCAAGQTNLNPNSSSFACRAWHFASYVRLTAVMPLLPDNFNDNVRLRFAFAVSAAARADVQDVLVSDPSTVTSRRGGASSVVLEAKVGAANASASATISHLQDGATLARELAAQGLPPPSSVSAVEVVEGGEGSMLPLAVGVSAAAFIAAISLTALSVWLGLRLQRHAAHQALVAACQSCQAGDDATARHLPLALRRLYQPVRVLGKGAFGCVVHARARKTGSAVAVKLVLPAKSALDQVEERRLRREGAVLRLLTDARCDSAVHLAAVDAVHVEPLCGWLLLELLDGEDLARVVLADGGRLGDMECVRLARSVLSALKVLHAEGLIHRDVKPANVMRCHNGSMDASASGIGSVASFGNGACEGEAVYKLIDFGTVIGVDEKLAKAEMMTITEGRDVGIGTPPYMSPEMFVDPASASFSTDLWSLGVTLFEVATGRLPFEIKEGGQLAAWARAVAGDPNERAPSLLDLLDEDRRSGFDGNLARVVARALEKDVGERFATADGMHEAVYRCLVTKGEAFYSVFISYRVASEAPLARLLFDELNHSVTPGGHRVTVYWDAFRLIKGEDWEEGFATGLLNSLCIFPVLSYGSTAPLAPLPGFLSGDARAAAAAEAWAARPLGAERLQGAEGDREDNVLKEWLIARSLLERGGEERQAGERGMLQAAYPILVGRPHPPGHPGYPGMGPFFAVQAGGGQYPSTPSPATARAVASFLRAKAGLPEEAAAAAEKCSVAAAVVGMTRLQGCMLWKHSSDLPEVELTKEQADMVGGGYSGPPADLDGQRLTTDQKVACSGGIDARQLRMLKAQVREKRADFHEIIDRAVASHARMALKSQRAAATAAAVNSAIESPTLYSEVQGGAPSTSSGSKFARNIGGGRGIGGRDHGAANAMDGQIGAVVEASVVAELVILP